MMAQAAGSSEDDDGFIEDITCTLMDMVKWSDILEVVKSDFDTFLKTLCKRRRYFEKEKGMNKIGSWANSGNCQWKDMNSMMKMFGYIKASIMLDDIPEFTQSAKKDIIAWNQRISARMSAFFNEQRDKLSKTKDGQSLVESSDTAQQSNDSDDIHIVVDDGFDERTYTEDMASISQDSFQKDIFRIPDMDFDFNAYPPLPENDDSQVRCWYHIFPSGKEPLLNQDHIQTMLQLGLNNELYDLVKLVSLETFRRKHVPDDPWYFNRLRYDVYATLDLIFFKFNKKERTVFEMLHAKAFFSVPWETIYAILDACIYRIVTTGTNEAVRYNDIPTVMNCQTSTVEKKDLCIIHELLSNESYLKPIDGIDMNMNHFEKQCSSGSSDPDTPFVSVELSDEESPRADITNTTQASSSIGKKGDMVVEITSEPQSEQLRAESRLTTEVQDESLSTPEEIDVVSTTEGPLKRPMHQTSEYHELTHPRATIDNSNTDLIEETQRLTPGTCVPPVCRSDKDASITPFDPISTINVTLPLHSESNETNAEAERDTDRPPMLIPMTRILVSQDSTPPDPFQNSRDATPLAGNASNAVFQFLKVPEQSFSAASTSALPTPPQENASQPSVNNVNVNENIRPNPQPSTDHIANVIENVVSGKHSSSEPGSPPLPKRNRFPTNPTGTSIFPQGMQGLPHNFNLVPQMPMQFNPPPTTETAAQTTYKGRGRPPAIQQTPPQPKATPRRRQPRKPRAPSPVLTNQTPENSNLFTPNLLQQQWMQNFMQQQNQQMYQAMLAMQNSQQNLQMTSPTVPKMTPTMPNSSLPKTPPLGQQQYMMQLMNSQGTGMPAPSTPARQDFSMQNPRMPPPATPTSAGFSRMPAPQMPNLTDAQKEDMLRRMAPPQLNFGAHNMRMPLPGLPPQQDFMMPNAGMPPPKTPLHPQFPMSNLPNIRPQLPNLPPNMQPTQSVSNMPLPSALPTMPLSTIPNMLPPMMPSLEDGEKQIAMVNEIIRKQSIEIAQNEQQKIQWQQFLQFLNRQEQQAPNLQHQHQDHHQPQLQAQPDLAAIEHLRQTYPNLFKNS